MINVLVDSLEKEGFQVLADHVGGPRERPSPIGDYVPDIEARKGSEVRLIEVETQSTLESDKAHEQVSRLNSTSSGKPYLAVPFDCLERARELRLELDIDFEILPCYPFVRYIGTPK
jgi:Holliday junction resolvase